jgi:hypothetical protein
MAHPTSPQDCSGVTLDYLEAMMTIAWDRSLCDGSRHFEVAFEVLSTVTNLST